MIIFVTKKGRKILAKDESTVEALKKLKLKQLKEDETDEEKTEKEIRRELFAEIAKFDIKQPPKNAKTEDLQAILDENK